MTTKRRPRDAEGPGGVGRDVGIVRAAGAGGCACVVVGSEVEGASTSGRRIRTARSTLFVLKKEPIWENDFKVQL